MKQDNQIIFLSNSYKAYNKYEFELCDRHLEDAGTSREKMEELVGQILTLQVIGGTYPSEREPGQCVTLGTLSFSLELESVYFDLLDDPRYHDRVIVEFCFTDFVSIAENIYVEAVRGEFSKEQSTIRIQASKTKDDFTGEYFIDALIKELR